MAEYIAEPDAEAVVVTFLSSELTVGTKVPKVRPAVFVRVRKVGGFRRGLVTFRPRFTVEGIANSEVAALGAVREAGALLWQAATVGVMGSTPVGDLNEISLPQNLPDPSLGEGVYRYTATYEIDMRAYGA